MPDIPVHTPCPAEAKPVRDGGLAHVNPGILYPDGHGLTPVAHAPDCFHDLNLDQITAALTAGRDFYSLREFIWSGPVDARTVRHRQQVMQDLENETISGIVRSFGAGMRDIREKLALVEKLSHLHQKTAWFLTAAKAYCGMVRSLAADLAAAPVVSEGLTDIVRFIEAHLRSQAFQSFEGDIARGQASLRKIRYVLTIKGDSVSVFRLEQEEDYGSEIARTFERFRTVDVEPVSFEIPDFVEMDHIEAAVLKGVCQLHPDIFAGIEAIFARHRDFIDPTVARFDRELQFYLAYIDYIEPLKKAGLRFCYPLVHPENKEVAADDTFDIVLAHKLVSDRKPVVTNSFELREGERIFVVSGPNQGGKTTFARTVGQLHYLACIGLPVPGTRAKLLLYDGLFTHFERQEDMHNLRGKLQDDLVRIHDVLVKATGRSVVIMNEIFTSTTLRDALFLGTRVLETIIGKKSLAVCVTFIDELSRLGPETVSLVSTVDPADAARRTFRIVRKPADGLAHAIAIAEKYRLTAATLQKRLKP